MPAVFIIHSRFGIPLRCLVALPVVPAPGKIVREFYMKRGCYGYFLTGCKRSGKQEFYNINMLWMVFDVGCDIVDLKIKAVYISLLFFIREIKLLIDSKRVEFLIWVLMSGWQTLKNLKKCKQI